MKFLSVKKMPWVVGGFGAILRWCFSSECLCYRFPVLEIQFLRYLVWIGPQRG
jgi:hypothetical protein